MYRIVATIVDVAMQDGEGEGGGNGNGQDEHWLFFTILIWWIRVKTDNNVWKVVF